MKRQLLTVSRLFRDYALQQPEFASLPASDQRRLLCRNTPLFLQYIMGRWGGKKKDDAPVLYPSDDMKSAG